MNILMLVTGNWCIDTRVINEKQTLEEQGHTVSIIDWKDKPTNKIQWFLHLWFWYHREYTFSKSICFDVVHCHDFDTLFLGVLLKKKLGCTLVYDCHEAYAFMTNIFLVLPFEKLFLTNADQVITVHEGVQSYLEYLKADDIKVVENGKYPVVPSYHEPGTTCFTVLYLGTLTRLRMFPKLLDAFKGFDDVKLVVGGYGAEYETVQQKAEEQDNIEFVGTVSPLDVLDYTLNADVILCMVDPCNRNCRLGIPNKFYECLVCGRPMIVTRDTHIGDIVEWDELGIATVYSIEGVRSAIKKYYDHPELTRQHGMNMYEIGKKRNWNTEKKKLVKIYENM